MVQLRLVLNLRYLLPIPAGERRGHVVLNSHLKLPLLSRNHEDDVPGISYFRMLGDRDGGKSVGGRVAKAK